MQNIYVEFFKDALKRQIFQLAKLEAHKQFSLILSKNNFKFKINNRIKPCRSKFNH